MKNRERIILALDVEKMEEAEEIVERFSPYINIYKIGPFLFYRFGEKIIKRIKKREKEVFLDLKLMDIPRVVGEGVKIAQGMGVDFLSLHILSGKSALQEAVRHKEEGLKLLGVTVLTSLGERDLKNFGFYPSLSEEVLLLAKMAKDAGLDGVVSSVWEAKRIKEKVGKTLLVICPGIRIGEIVGNDQRRVATPQEAFREGADFIVMGRSLIREREPGRILEEI